MSMFVAITGTPGVGKSTVSDILAHKYRVVHIHEYAEQHNLFESYDEKMGSYDVDVEKLNDSVMSEKFSEKYVFFDGHLSHFIDCDIIIVLRCRPKILYDRLKARGYDDEKVMENVQAEVLDVILGESMESGAKVFEIDCSDMTPINIADRIERIVILGETDDSSPGNVDWSVEMEEWF